MVCQHYDVDLVLERPFLQAIEQQPNHLVDIPRDVINLNLIGQ